MAGKKTKPKQEVLEGMEDMEIKPLRDAALEYADIRDQRQELTKDEVNLKARVLALMKKHGKETYKYNGIEIRIVHEEEGVKVKVTQPNVEVSNTKGKKKAKGEPAEG